MYSRRQALPAVLSLFVISLPAQAEMREKEKKEEVQKLSLIHI